MTTLRDKWPVPAIPLTYEQMLSELRGLLGSEVAVVLELMIARRQHPLATFSGELRLGQAVDLERLFADHEGFPPGEAVLFFVGEARGSCFALRKADFKFGRRDETLLSFMTGKVTTGVIPV